MEKFGQILEIIIKAVLAIFSTVACVFVVKNAISMLSFFKLNEVDDILFFNLLDNTIFGKVYNNLGVVIQIDFNTIIKGFILFLINLDYVVVMFIIIFIILIVLYFIFIKWQLIKSYIKMSLILIFSYLAKHIFVLFILAILNDFSTERIYLSFKIGAIIYVLFSFIELTILSLWIIKFVLNLYNDIKYLRNHC